MPLTANGYVAEGMEPAGKSLAGFAPAAPKTANATSGFSPSWSWQADPTEAPKCGTLKKDGTVCKAPPHTDGLCFGHSRKR